MLRIRYQDDGRGLNQAKVKELAVEKGLIAADDSLDDAELARVIFEPGFSTSSEVNDISGRGVGMNAVKEYVEQENGQVRLQLLAQQRGGCHPFVFEVDLGDNLYITVPKAA